MVPRSAEIRAWARESLDGNWGKAVGATIIYLIAAMVIGSLNYIPFIGWIVELLLAGPLALGFYAFFLGVARGEGLGVRAVFSGFERFVDAFLLCLLMGIFTFLWTLLFIIPGIIAAFRYKMAYYILRDNPEIGPLEAISQSKQMMKGHKWRLFVLYLTFIGWYILGSIPLGIGLLWVVPYITTAEAHFYEDLRSRSAEVPPPPPPVPGSAAFTN
ncbi:DUF975 domain-containing protein [Cohnella lubricantis]|uniref:DUF975 family protein n=1 Tax=Cohnella lubricantis TaxID=2163172 RepID=A0A841TI20_9BACL|nr:DUF975 family protein [Cohnella lubricantis]MBB6678880.1 DUF975 family protein [Cohnella lubricantis]MBP2120205.1 putative membrane protein [Cohnella lubricantis]